MPIYRGTEKVTPRLGEQSLSRVYRGTDLVWQSKVLAPFSYDFGFNDLPNIWWAPISGYDYRTHASAPRTPAWTFNGMLVAPDNNQPAYLGHLLNRKRDGSLTATITFGDAMNTVAYPTTVIIRSNFDQSDKLEFAFGSDGIRLNHVTGYTVRQLWSSNYSIGSRKQLRIEDTGKATAAVYDGDMRLGAINLGYHVPDLLERDWGYFGFGVMSTAGQWSSRIDRIQFSGMSTYGEEPVGRASTRRITLARSSWTEIAAIHVNSPMVAKTIRGSTSWPNVSGVQVRLKVNGQVVGTSTGTSTSLSNVSIGANQWVLLEAYTTNSTTANRRPSDGYLEITET